MACQAWYCQYFVFVHNQSICLLWFKLLKGSWAFFEIIGKPHSVAGLGMCLLGLGIFTCVPFGPFTTSMMLPCDSPASRPTQCKVGSSKYSGRRNIDHITHWVLIDLKNYATDTVCSNVFNEWRKGTLLLRQIHDYGALWSKDANRTNFNMQKEPCHLHQSLIFLHFCVCGSPKLL